MTPGWIVTIERIHPAAAEATRSVLRGVAAIPAEVVDEVLSAGVGRIRVSSLDQANSVMLKLNEVGVPTRKEPEALLPEAQVAHEAESPAPTAEKTEPGTAAPSARRHVSPLMAAAAVLLIGALGFSAGNYFQLQRPMADVVREDPRNVGVKVSVRYSYYINSAVLVYDLRDIRLTNSMVDVFRVFLQFAERLRGRRFEMVELSFRGTTKFKISGEYFRELGGEYGTQNPVYTMRTFPEHLLTVDGSPAYPGWSGGWLGVTLKQMEDFHDFHARWYLREIAGVEGAR